MKPLKPDLRDEVALVTGASSGIGAASARALAQAGASVALLARRADRLEALAQELGPASLAVPADLAEPGAAAAAVAAVRARFGRLDLLVNNAGFGRLAWLDQLTAAEAEAQVRVNLMAPIELTRLVLPDMLARGRGHCLFVASLAGLIGAPTYSVYGATKAALRSFAEALRREVTPFGVHVSVLSPGGVSATEFTERAGIQRRTGVTTPRWLRPSAETVAQAVVGLARRPRRELVIPWPLGGLAWLNQVAPALADWIVVTAFTRRERRPPPARPAP